MCIRSEAAVLAEVARLEGLRAGPNGRDLTDGELDQLERLYGELDAVRDAEERAASWTRLVA